MQWKFAVTRQNCLVVGDLSIPVGTGVSYPDLKDSAMKRLTGWLLTCILALPVWAANEVLPVRLPPGVTPTAYKLSLVVDPNKAQHSGEVEIAVTINKPGRVIRVNAAEIAMQSARLEINGKAFAAKARIRNTDLVDLEFSAPFPAGQAVLKMAFTGRVEEKSSQGLFRQEEGGAWYAFTQFENISARRVFPGFDEPGWKVPWDLALTIPQDMTAVASAPMLREVVLGNGLKRVEFQTTKPLPSYLLAFGVGPFDILDGGMVGKTPVRFITPHGRAQEARFAASVTPEILGHLKAYFGMPYPYEKLDLMALPITLGFSAMENPGLVTFSSRAILAKPGEESMAFQRRFVSTQAHELAHMWFGDLVTMAWWDDLWLNESFASWMADKITSQMAPQYHAQNGTQDARAWAMRTDRLRSTTQIYQPVSASFSQNDQGGGQDGAILYGKGQAILAMFETWIGADRFQTGVRHYMAKHAWGNATGEDFVAALAQGDTDLAKTFNTFTHQAGIPRVAMELDCSGPPTLVLSQSRFLPHGVVVPLQPLWAVPVTVRTPTGTAQILLKERNARLALPDTTCPAWFQGNASGSGYYRTAYANGQLQKLVQSGALTLQELLANLDDAQALTESGDMTMAAMLQMALPLAQDSRREVVEAILDILIRIKPLIAATDQSAYAAVWQNAFGARARALGWLDRPADSADERLLRYEWVGRFTELGQDTVLREQARVLAQAWLVDRKALPAVNRASVLQAAAYQGDRVFFDALLAAVQGNPDRRERRDIYGALVSFHDPQLAQAGRQLWLSPQHDIREVMTASITRGRVVDQPEPMFEFFRHNFAALVKKLPADTPEEMPQMFGLACDAKLANQMERFFKPLAPRYAGLQKNLEKTLETVRVCANYRRLQQTSLQAYLKKAL